MTTYFCDGLREVTVINGVVRLEFHRLEAVQRGQNRELQPVVEFTVALPVQGFMQALGVLESAAPASPSRASSPPPPLRKAAPRRPRHRRSRQTFPDRHPAEANSNRSLGPNFRSINKDQHPSNVNKHAHAMLLRDLLCFSKI